MERIKIDNMEGATCVDSGALMMTNHGKVVGYRGIVRFGYAIKEDRIALNLMYDDFSIVSDVNSDHIQMMRDIIKAYERQF